MGNFSRSMSKFDVFITASHSLRSSSFHFFSDLGRAGKKNYDVNENILFAELRLTVMTHSLRAREAFQNRISALRHSIVFGGGIWAAFDYHAADDSTFSRAQNSFFIVSRADIARALLRQFLLSSKRN